MKIVLGWLRNRSGLDKTLLAGGFIGLVAIVTFFIWWLGSNDFEIVNNSDNALAVGMSKLSGLPCLNPKRRPIAVMLAADNVARPLTAIGQADMVFEMPVTPEKIPRYLAIFQCQNFSEIGSIRSAREDFLPLVGQFNALYVHWGGEKEVLNKLNSGVLDNIDALKYDGTTFYRKKGIPMPHNGFTNAELLLERAEDLSYNLEPSFVGFKHSDKINVSKNLANIDESIEIDYASPYEVKWAYNQSTKEYDRLRGGISEVDKATNKQVSAKSVVVMETKSAILNQDYIQVNVTGSGQAKFHVLGTVINGSWEKGTGINDHLVFYNNEREEMIFPPGVIWVNITTNPQ